MESAYRTEVRDQFTDEQLAELWADNQSPKHGAWSREALLLATQINELRNLIYVQLLRGGVKDAKPPEPLRTPGSTGTFQKSTDPRAVAYLQQIRERHAREVG